MTGIDVHELRDLAAQLNKAAVEVLPKVQAVVRESAGTILKDAQARVSGLKAVPGAPGALSYDTTPSATGSEAEIGYDKGGPGSLGNFLEYGSVNNAPIPALGPALDTEAPNVEESIGDVGEKALER